MTLILETPSEMAFWIWSTGMPEPPWRTSGRSPTCSLISPRRSNERPAQSSGVHAVDVADAAGEEVDAQIGDLLALGRIGELAGGGHAVLGAADAADLSLDGEALGMGELHELLGAVEVELEGLLVGAVVHDGGEARLDGLEAVLVRTMVEVERHGDGHAGRLDGGLDHVGADLEAAHPLGGTGGALDDQRAISESGSWPPQRPGEGRASTPGCWC